MNYFEIILTGCSDTSLAWIIGVKTYQNKNKAVKILARLVKFVCWKQNLTCEKDEQSFNLFQSGTLVYRFELNEYKGS